MILASYADGFAARWGRQTRNLIDEFGQGLYGVQLAGDSSRADQWSLAGHDGGMRTVGTGGSITGVGAHLLIVDDPIKNAEQADSALYRQKTWDWWQGTISTRLEPEAVVIVLHTRWHHDDLIGRLLPDDQWSMINFPAIAEDHDVLGRVPGDPLWPERYDVDALRRIELAVGRRWWNAQYQQRPTANEGGLFKREWWQVVDAAPAGERLKVVRYWDKAGTAGGGCYTAGVLILRTEDGLFYVLDVIRGQWAAHEREQVILTTAQMDRQLYPQCVQWVEQEPGSGGKESAERTIRMLAGMTCKADRVTGSKELRWEPWAAQVGAGNVRLVAAPWNREFIDEHCEAPHGTYRDQIDASSGAFAKLAGRKGVDLEKFLEIM